MSRPNLCARVSLLLGASLFAAPAAAQAHWPSFRSPSATCTGDHSALAEL